MLLTFSTSLAVYTAGFGLDVLSMTAVYAPLSSLIPDLIPKQQRGTASGWMQFFTNFGALSACVLGLFASDMGTVPHAFQFNAYLTEIAVLLAFVVFVMVFFVREKVNDQETTEKYTIGGSIGRVKQVLNFNFLCLATVSLFCIGFGNTIVQSYYQYYVSDTIPMPIKFLGKNIPNAETASAVFLLFILIGCSIASYPAGKLADRFPRKGLVVVTLLLQAAASVGICIKQSFELDLLCAFFYGLGYAGFSVISFAILTDILGANLEEGEYALGTGLYYFVQFSFMPLLYGYIIDYYHHHNHPMMGYYLLYGQCAAGLVLGAFLILLLRPIEKKVHSIQ